MPGKNLTIVLVTTFFAFCTLYTPQPILPLLAEIFAVSSTEVALLIGVTMLPLGLAPIVFGYFLQVVSARAMLRHAILLLAVSNLLLALADQFWQLLLLRAVQGLLLPAIFTALMTYCSAIAPTGRVRQYIAYYIATTILGGYGGRALSGSVATGFHWQDSFLLLCAGLLCSWLLLWRLDLDVRPDYCHPDPKAISRAWRRPALRYALLTVFTFFFTFSALLNTLPFRLVDLSPGISEFSISAIYTGYLIGVVSALHAEKILHWFGGQTAALRGVFATYLIALSLFCIPDARWTLVYMLCVSACFFLLHSILSGFVNQLAQNDSSHGDSAVVNGLYVSFYYAGGALGACLPTFVYRDFGWYGFTATLCAVLALSYAFSERMRRST